MINLSASLIKDFITCPKRAHYRMTHPEQSIQTSKMAAGSVVHEVIEKFWNKPDVAFEEADKLIKHYNIKGERSLSSSIYKSIENFFELFPFTFSEDDIVEKYFKYSYKSDFNIVGKIDRIHDEIILDWKTGEYPPEDVNKDIQFILYYLSYKKLYNKEPKKVLYVSLPHKKIYEFEPIPQIIDNFEREILPYVSECLKNGPFPRYGLYTWKTCKNCSFSNICYGELNIE